MKLELVSHTLCPYVHRAAVMIHEKGAPFERRYVDLKHKPEWFLAISPRGKVPVLVADGVPLFESSAICEFIDETHPPSLLPTDPVMRARHRAWVEVANDLSNAQYKVLTAPSPLEQETATLALAAVTARFEDALAGGVIAPEGFGLPHVALASSVLRFAIVEEQWGVRLLDDSPRLGALVRRLRERPSIRDTVPASYAATFLGKLIERGSLFAPPRPVMV